MTDHELEEALGMCCGNVRDTIDHIHMTLAILNDRHQADTKQWEHHTERLKVHLGGELYSPMVTVYLHFLDKLGLIEHGSGITGSWLDSDGEKILEELNRRKPLDRIVEATSD